MGLNEIGYGFLTDDDLVIRDSNDDLKLKLSSIKQFIADTTSNVSDDELNGFEIAYQRLLQLNDEFFENFKQLRQSKLNNDVDRSNELGKSGGTILDEFNNFDISDNFVLMCCDFRLQSIEQNDSLAKARCELLYEILKEQMLLRTLLKIRTQKTPNLITDYVQYL